MLAPTIRSPLAIVALVVLCRTICFADWGPANGVANARLAEQKAWKAYCGSAPCAAMSVSDVAVVGNYALATWEGFKTGGQSLLRFDNGHWHRIGHGGGVMDITVVEGYGAPRAVATRLVEHNTASAAVQRRERCRNCRNGVRGGNVFGSRTRPSPSLGRGKYTKRVKTGHVLSPLCSQ